MLLRLIPASLLVATFTASALVEPSVGESSVVGAAPSQLKSLRSAIKVKRSAAQQLADLEASGGDLSTLDLDPANRTSRTAYPKKATPELNLPVNPRTGEVDVTGEIVLKLRDDLGARAPRVAPTDRITSTIGRDLSGFDAVLAQFGGTVQQWITNKTDGALRKIELRAEVASGRGQPDYASFMKVMVPRNVLLEAGRALNDLPEVEFVSFARNHYVHQNEGCNPQNETICNKPGLDCPTADPITGCNPDPGCQMDPQNCKSGCADTVCCQMIGDLIPYCDDPEQPQGWDLVCAAYANLLCDQTIYDVFGPLPPDQRYDPCFTDGTGAPNPLFEGVAVAISGSCYEAHDGRGCSVPACCFAVCGIDPTCCTVQWDATCVSYTNSLALEAACVSAVDPGPTPNFKSEIVENPAFGAPGEPPFLTTNWQAYLSVWPAVSDIPFFPPTNPDPSIVFTQTGWRGGGFDLDGVRALQTQFANVYQGGAAPKLNGQGIKVGIVEFSAFPNHEDFTLGADLLPLAQPGVISEPGQTLIQIIDAVEHGTACLGICVARDNGFGVSGIAYEAQGYFFPTLSLEEGSRTPNALMSAMELFDYGDVLNFSFGPGGGPIIIEEQMAALVLGATDLGINCVMSAGNDSVAIAEAPFETNAIVVGACFPGSNGPVMGCGQPGIYHYCRLGFSNYENPDDDEGLGAVHVAGWGEAVTTTGYGVLFRGQNGTDPNDPQTNHLRTYTNAFNGTSSAGPVVAGLVAVMQGWCKQIYGSAISPAQMRNVLMQNGTGDQCAPNTGPTGQPPYAFGPDQPDCNNGEWRSIGTFPDALGCAYAILGGQFVDGNATEIKVLYGNVMGNATSFVIRADDQNYLKIQTQYASAGTTVQGLAYMAGGPTTDTLAFLQTNASPGEITGVALVTDGVASAPNVLLGGFLWNNKDNRWDFIGVGFLAPGGGGATLGVNPFNTPNYVSSSGTVSARVWTCGLGFTPPHQVWHDLIQIVAVGPTLPAPEP